MLSFAGTAFAAFRTGRLLAHVLCDLVVDHHLLELLEQGLSFRQAWPERLGPQHATVQLGRFPHRFGIASVGLDNDLYLHSHRKAPLRIHPSPDALRVVPNPTIQRSLIEAMQQEPLPP